MTTTPATPPEGEREHQAKAQWLRDECAMLANGGDERLIVRWGLIVASAYLELLAAGYVRPAPTQEAIKPPPEENALSNLVHRFCDALLSKLRRAEDKYGYQNAWRRAGWAVELREALLTHVDKGDPLDVAAYCAFAWHHGWSLAGETAPTQGDRETARQIMRDSCESVIGSSPYLTDFNDGLLERNIAAALAAQRATLEARVAELEAWCGQWRAAAESKPQALTLFGARTR